MSTLGGPASATRNAQETCSVTRVQWIYKVSYTRYLVERYAELAAIGT